MIQVAMLEYLWLSTLQVIIGYKLDIIVFCTIKELATEWVMICLPSFERSTNET